MELVKPPLPIVKRDRWWVINEGVLDDIFQDLIPDDIPYKAAKARIDGAWADLLGGASVEYVNPD